MESQFTTCLLAEEIQHYSEDVLPFQTFHTFLAESSQCNAYRRILIGSSCVQYYNQVGQE